jgi:hypothetical protein
MKAIVLGIDGTGPMRGGEYGASMNDSFVSNIVRKSTTGVKRYMRGPGFDGLDMALIARAGHRFVQLGLVASPGATILLTGYSRGGAGVIDVARRLASDNIEVAAMVLFDAVDRALGVDATDIPNNVQRLVHARRHPRAGSRESFSSCGIRWHAPTICELKLFLGTHGALGGVPWKGPKANELVVESWPDSGTNVSYIEDARAARTVWDWVEPRLKKLGYLGHPAAEVSTAGKAVV